MRTTNTLTYILTSAKDKISFNHLESDLLSKQTYMDSLVGTLVKNHDQIRFTPYLASSWTTDDFITWKFKMRTDITTEDGELITPLKFKKSLENVIKIYHKIRPSLPIIEEIYGFSEYVHQLSPDLKGIQVKDNELLIRFNRPINSGVLEFLSMPYYGFYSDKNFRDGKWANDLKIISSGSHFVESINTENNILILKKRDGWFSIAENAVDKIEIKQMNLEMALIQTGPKIIKTNNYVDVNQVQIKNLNYVAGVPDMMVGLSLNFKNGFFSNEDNRKYFLKKIREAQNTIKLENEGLIFSEFFYPSYQTVLIQSNNVSNYKNNSKKIVILCPASPSKNRPKYVKSIIEKALEGSGIELDFQTEVPSNKIKTMYADIRVFGVSIGGGFEHWLTKMMFCSDLGVQLPDPDNRICNLVDKYDGLNWDINEFAKEFNNILYDQAATIPLYHNSYKWIIDGVDIELSPISLIPRFDLMKLK